MLQTYKHTDMVYKDYKWQARADHDNPKIISGADHNELNRSEGYEMLYFINSLGTTWGWNNYPLSSYQHLERIIRSEVPHTTRTHTGIRLWIENNYRNV